jgi:hypothetical protein
MLAWFDLNTPAHTTTTPQVDDDGSDELSSPVRQNVTYVA